MLLSTYLSHSFLFQKLRLEKIYKLFLIYLQLIIIFWVKYEFLLWGEWGQIVLGDLPRMMKLEPLSDIFLPQFLLLNYSFGLASQYLPKHFLPFCFKQTGYYQCYIWGYARVLKSRNVLPDLIFSCLPLLPNFIMGIKIVKYCDPNMFSVLY